jgi:Tfp pilus assembly protein PilF
MEHLGVGGQFEQSMKFAGNGEENKGRRRRAGGRDAIVRAMRPPRAAEWYRSDLALGLLLLASVVVAYWPALNGAPVWDDDRHITNAMLQGWDGLRRIWFDLGATQQYYPVLHSAFWIEHRLWGESSLGYHLANVGWHGISACLIVLITREMGIRGGWAAGLLFALHPVHAESVAWISEQKNTLSLVFYLLAALAWLRFDASRARREWWLGFALFALALGSKTVTATLPCVLLVVVWWKRGRIDWRRDVAPLVPWLVLGVAAGLMTAWVERYVIGAEGMEFTLSPVQRILVAGRALWHYFATFAWPSALAFTYPRWIVNTGDVTEWLYPTAALLAAGVLWALRRRARAPFAVFAACSGTLFPALGFLNVYPFRYSFVADHFQYHADVPLAMLAGAGLTWLIVGDEVSGVERASRSARSATQTILGVLALCAIFIALTWKQAGEYRDAETLYRATLVANPDSWMAHHNLGRIVSRRANGLSEAIEHFEAAIRLKPDHARAHYSLGVALQRAGRGEEAVPHFEAAIRFEPNNAPLVANAEYLLGVEAMKRPGGAAEAARHFAEALKRKPLAETEKVLNAARAQAARDSVKR